MFAQPQTLHGIKVIVSPDQPKMKLAPGDYVTPAFRAEIDAWLMEFFGMTNLLPDGACYHMPMHNAFTMNPRTYAQLIGAAAPKGTP